jgi:hypothetical protein
MSSTQSQPAPARNIEQERLQIAQLDAMLLTAFKADPPPQRVRDSWDRFILEMKLWKGLANDEERASISSGSGGPETGGTARIANNGDSIGS